MSNRLRDLAEVHYGKSPNDVLSEDSTVPVIGTGGIYGRASRSLFSGPAVVVARKGTLGNPQFVDGPFWPVDTTYAVLAKAGVDTKWLYYSLAAFDLTKLNEATGVPSISRDWLYKVPLGATNFETQRRIAEILSTLDDAIEQTEALIAKHQQLKAGLMHDLFTRGVTPDGHLRPTREQAPDLYKESPLGWIPTEWEVKPLRDLTIKIADRDHTTPEYVDDGVVMVSPTNLFDDEGIDFAVCRNIPLRDHLINRRKTDIESGDLILHRIGAGLGAVRLVTDDMPEFSILHSMALVRPLRSAVSAEYLLWSFRSYPVMLQMDIGTQSIGVPDLGLDKIGSLFFPVAPHGEQIIIANSLRTQTEAGSAERNCLTKLRQQKNGLMHDLLTGRIRVKFSEKRDARG